MDLLDIFQKCLKAHANKREIIIPLRQIIYAFTITDWPWCSRRSETLER